MGPGSNFKPMTKPPAAAQQQPVRLSGTFGGSKAPDLPNPISNAGKAAGGLGDLNSLSEIPSLDFDVGKNNKPANDLGGAYVPTFGAGGGERRPRRNRGQL